MPDVTETYHVSVSRALPLDAVHCGAGYVCTP